MPMIIRDADPTLDYPVIAQLLSSESNTPVKAEYIADWDRNNPAGQMRRRAVGVVDGVIIGYSLAYYHPSSPPGAWQIHVIIGRATRGKGYGHQLYADVIAFAREHGATTFRCEVSETEPDGRAFAERRGFRLHKHRFSSQIDLASFDDRTYGDSVPKAESAGIRFSSLAAEGNTLEAQRRLYDLNRETARDNPSADGGDGFLTFDIFQQQVLNASWFQPAGQLLAIDGDHWVGLCAISLDANPPSAYNAFTGVRASHRGRGIAQALKHLGIRYAKTHRALTISTDNDSENAPMLHINRSLGYRPQPGAWVMVKQGEENE